MSVLFLAAAQAAPLSLDLPEPGFQAADRSRFGVVVPSNAGPVLLASPVVHEKPAHTCDGDEWAFGDPDGRVAPPRWCPSGGEEDSDPALIPLRADIVLESASDLDALDPVRTVWSHSFWHTHDSSRLACGDQVWADSADGVLHGLSRDANVHVGVLELGELRCEVRAGAQGFRLEDCPLPPGEAGELRLFDFARTPSCEDPTLPAVVLNVTTPEAAVLVEVVEEPVEVESAGWNQWLLVGLAGIGGVLIGLIVARIRERSTPTTDEAAAVRSRLELKDRRIGDLQLDLHRAREQAKRTDARVAQLEAANAALAGRLQESAPPPMPAPPPPDDGLESALAQALGYAELREACQSVCDLGTTTHGDLFRQGRDLLESSQRLRTLVEGDYHARWEELEARFREGYRELSAFALGAQHLGAGDLAAVVRAVRAERAFQPRSSRPGRGLRAWSSLAPAVERKQQDGGLALANALRREVFNRVIVPWLRLSQLLVEALPHELPEAPPVDVPVAAHIGAALARLGYDYEHVPLYAVNEREFLNRKVLTTPTAASEVLGQLPKPAAASAGVIVRVNVPLVTRAPRGHTVRAVLVYLEEG